MLFDLPIYPLMQKVAKYTIQELGQTLHNLTRILHKGNNREWSRVFQHYYHETESLLEKNYFDLNSLRNLIRNIRICFENSTLRNIELESEYYQKSNSLIIDFFNEIEHLDRILDKIEEQSADYIC